MAALATLAPTLLAAAWLAVALAWAWRRKSARLRLAAAEARCADLSSENQALRGAAKSVDLARSEAGEGMRRLATVSHELRTPLAGVQGLAALLLCTRLNAEQTAYVQAIDAAVKASNRLIDDVLEAARLSADGVELVEAALDPATLVEEAAELLAPRAQGKGIEIATLIRAGTPLRVRGDGQRMRQVLLNLIGNAIKFTKTGGVGIELKFGDGALTFIVQDTGIGVPENRRRAIFEEFRQAQTDSARDGSGLGLPISVGLARRMGGEVTLESTSAAGSAFQFRLPITVLVPPSPPAPTPAGARALVLAPRGFQADYLQIQLRSAGYSTQAEHDPTAAMTCLAQAPAGALIFADASLGAETLPALADQAKKSRAGRSILLLSPFERRDIGEAAELGYDGWLVKPIRRVSLWRESAGRPERGLAGKPPIRPRVLVADDDDIGVLVARRHLHRLGAEAVCARDGPEAARLALAAAHGEGTAFDAILLDIRMPGLNGDEIAAKIRASEARAGAGRIALAALTSENVALERERLIAAGFDELQRKPLDPDWLERFIDAARSKADPRAA